MRRIKDDELSAIKAGGCEMSSLLWAGSIAGLMIAGSGFGVGVFAMVIFLGSTYDMLDNCLNTE